MMRIRNWDIPRPCLHHEHYCSRILKIETTTLDYPVNLSAESLDCEGACHLSRPI